MRKTLLFFMLLSVKLTFAQVDDDFTDGNFTSDPPWLGQASLYNINNSKQLQSSTSSISQVVSLSTANYLALNTQWEFFVQINFDPSTSNQARIYLISDRQDLKGPLNGYFVQIGENGAADSYDLYRQTGTTVVKIIDGPAKIRSNANLLTARVKVSRSDIGRWELATDITGGTTYALEGNVTDLTHINTDWFGVSCEYTATRSSGFIFDSFKVFELTPDITPPSLTSASVVDEFNVEAVFSERLQLTTALLASSYSVAGLGAPNTVTPTLVPNVYRLTFASPLLSGEYRLSVTAVRDLKGNLIGGNNTATFYYVTPYTLKTGDLLISEILTNPRTGGVDFIEIYNNSNQVLDLKGLQLANLGTNGAPANIKNVSTVSVYMPPKTYWVLTTNPTIVKQQYLAKFPNQFVQMSSLPAFNNDKGAVVLLGTAGILEQLLYDEKMHLGLLQDGDGIALERISFIKEVGSRGNFQSAAQSVGFATPTYKNSQAEELGSSKSIVTLANKVFSPDGDGFDDLLRIDYSFINGGNLASVNIYTDRGVLVRKLERNTSIATAGTFTWNGLNDAGQQSRIGIYVVKFDAFNLSGKMQSFKQTCVLAAKLN